MYTWAATSSATLPLLLLLLNSIHTRQHTHTYTQHTQQQQHTLPGEEEVPHGVVGVVVLGDSPDVLSHCAVRARNARVPVVACPRWVLSRRGGL